MSDIRKNKDVVAVAPLANVNLFYNNGKSQVDGISLGVNILEADAMFDITSIMIEGNVKALANTPNGIIIGVGIANKLSLKLNDNLSITSAFGVIKQMKIVGIFKSTIAMTDKSKSYINLSTAQQLLKQNPNYVTDIYVNIKDPSKALAMAEDLKKLTGYTVEDWMAANEQFVTGKKVRGIMLGGVSWAILLVAAFGIYNILNMTITSKLNDIAILKATGFAGKDVVRIFVGEALIMGIIGTLAGVLLSMGLVEMLSHVYIGGDLGYFPIQFEPQVTITGIIIGILVTVGAGYIPARKAAKIDPITIFRK